MSSNEIWIPKILKFGFLENGKNFWSEIKNIFPSSTSSLFYFRLKKQTSKNVTDTTFKNRGFHEVHFSMINNFSKIWQGTNCLGFNFFTLSSTPTTVKLAADILTQTILVYKLRNDSKVDQNNFLLVLNYLF